MPLRAHRVATIVAGIAVLSAAKCGGDSAATPSADNAKASSQPTRAAQVPSQSTQRDPCSWITRAEAQKALGDSVIAEPVRVRSTETVVPQSNGGACQYQLRP